MKSNLILFLLGLFLLLNSNIIHAQIETIPATSPNDNVNPIAKLNTSSNSTVSAESEISATIHLFFEGLYDGNLDKMKTTVWEDAALVSTFKNKEGKEIIRNSTMKDFLEAASKPREDKWNEKIWDLKIESEGRLGHAIMNYAFFLNEDFIHCGANAMQLVKMDGQWKIVALSDTRMKSACDEAAIKKRFE